MNKQTTLGDKHKTQKLFNSRKDIKSKINEPTYLNHSHNSFTSNYSKVAPLTFASISLIKKAGTSQEGNTLPGFHFHSSVGGKNSRLCSFKHPRIVSLCADTACPSFSSSGFSSTTPPFVPLSTNLKWLRWAQKHVMFPNETHLITH